MLRIPKIEPVRVKTQPINRELIDPGSLGRYFPPEVGPRVVYLDQCFDCPPQEGNDPDAERTRQDALWKQAQEAGVTQFLDSENDRTAEERNIREAVQQSLGRRDTAEFYEYVFAHLFDTSMDIVIISTGVSPGDGSNYHDIGYLRA